MGTVDRNVKFVNLMSHGSLLKDVTTAVVSPLFNLITLVSKQKDGSVYLLPNNGNVESFWQSPSKTKTCLFSEDGKQLLLLLSVNSLLIFKIEEEGLSKTLQIKASDLATLLKDYSIDYSSFSSVKPLLLKRNELLAEIDGRLVCLDWNFLGSDVAVRYSITLPSYRELCLSPDEVFILQPSNVISFYTVSNGLKLAEELNLCLANRANSDLSVGRNFFKFAVDETSHFLAVVNQDERTFLFDISELFDRTDGKPVAVVETKKDKWSWPGKRKSVVDSQSFPGRILGQIEAFSGVVVSSLQFSLHGLFVFYSVLGHTSCSSFKVVDETNGTLLCAMDELVDYRLVSGGNLPLFMSESVLSICLGALSVDPIVSKLCEIIPEFSVKEFGRTMHQTSAAKENIDVYSSFMKIIFSLHSTAYRLNLKKLSNGNLDDMESALIEKKMIERVESLTALLLEPDREERLVAITYLHLVHLLDQACLQIKNATGPITLRIESLITAILVRLDTLYPLVKHLDLLQYEWVAWRETPEPDIVQEAVILGTVALALVFFTMEKDWNVENAVDRFKTEANKYVVELISIGDLEKASLVLQTLGFDPLEHFRNLCLETNEPLMRDLLISHLQNAQKITEEEMVAWQFCKKIETALASIVKSYRGFDHKMVVAATEHAKIIKFKLMPFKGTLSLRTVLKQSSCWRDFVLTEAYFVTGDSSLEPDLDKNLCWQFLIERNCVDLLISWVDVSFDPGYVGLQQSNYLFKVFVALFSNWPVTSEMLEDVTTITSMAATKSSVLDRAASYGVFSKTEQKDIALVIFRLQYCDLLPMADEILSKPTANVSINDLYAWVLKESHAHELKLPVLTCLRKANIENSLAENAQLFPWLRLWRSFEAWDGRDSKLLLQLIHDSRNIFPATKKEESHLKIAMALAEGKEVLELIEEEGNESDLLTIPLIDICWQSLQRAKNRSPDVTLYDLLAGSQLPVAKLLAWQTENKYVSDSHVPESFPHFNHQVLSAKYGFRQHLDYLFYLKQSRPSFACNLFIVENLRTHRRLTTKMINRACGYAHGLALRLWREESVGSACVSFIAMLGDIPSCNALRLHLSAIAAVADYLPDDQKKFVGTLAYGIANMDSEHLQDLAALLELAIMQQIEPLDAILQVRKWAVPITFCNMHGIPLPTLLPRHFARKKDWFHFILCLDLFKYPYEQAIELIEEMEAPVLKAHLLRALTRTTLKLATTSPSKSPPRIRLEPESGGEDVDVKDVFQTFVTNVYTEVMTTIQTFTDRNIVLPWSCEQNPDEDVLLTLLKCESEPDTGRALLFASLELQSPILAVLSTCFPVENVVAPLIAWLLSSIPASLPRCRLREEAQLLPQDRNFSGDQVQALLFQFFTTGYFQTFFRGMTLFMPDNPLTLIVEAIYRCVVELDSEGALPPLKSFVQEMVHGSIIRVKDSVLGCREWIIGTAARLLESILTRPDVVHSTKIKFLKLLADAELTSVDPVFPKFLLWYQICEILEPTQVRLDFAPLYDLMTVSGELERCLEELFRTRAFAPALEISALLSLNKDRIIVAVWEQNFEEAVRLGDVNKIWGTSSAAFKDENVNPSVVADFYRSMADKFDGDSAESPKNKFLALRQCLTWRKLVEDTLPHSSYCEQSDSIELELWQCCLVEGFDQSILQSETSKGLAFSILVNNWPIPRLLVRAPKTSQDPLRVTTLINTLLDAGDLHSAIRVSAFFTCENQDLTTIVSCMQVCVKELAVSELSKYSAMLGSPRKLLNSVAIVELEGFEVVPSSRDQSPALALVERLCASVSHGLALANRIFVCFRLSLTLDFPFKEIATETDYLLLLNRIVTADCPNKMMVASDMLTLASLPDSALAKFLAECIVAAITSGLATGLDVPPRLWDISLDDGFHSVIAIMENPSVLGLELLNATATLNFPECVEVLIRAHDCYTVACNVEGIGRVFRRARILANQILQAQQWRYLVRLLVGIGRFSDMSYIFQMLKDNDQFEQLLKKGLTKAPSFRLAVSDFLLRTCPENRELGKMVAAYFGLHSSQADLWKAEADEIIEQLTPPLKDTSKTRQLLNLAMDNYQNASMWYLQAGKMNMSLKIARQAQMIALQISLLGGPYIINVIQPQLQSLAQESLSLNNIRLIARARDLQLDWLAIIQERWILRGDKTFFNDCKTAGLLTPVLITRYLQRYEKDQSVSNKIKDRVKQLAAILPTAASSPLLKDYTRLQQR